jgi:hypothetical protein
VKVAEFLENFQVFLEAPNGIEKAKDLVLTLAFHGRFVA